MINEIEMLLPDNKWRVEKPEISIVIPALNEEITISEFVNWCWQGLAKAGVTGEVIIVDSSSDKTPELALAAGAKVLRVPKRGLGQAYLDAIPYIGADFVILGDCDLTYDFRELGPFIEGFRAENEFVMGSRFRGSIESGAMPKLHQYFGTPLTTWILNTIYQSDFTDIHCGMRGVTLKALKQMQLSSKGWEYASEMVIKATRLKLKIHEVPVHFYKDREGRFSHHKRAGILSPWLAGWVNLKVMLIYSAESFLFPPALILFVTGALAAVASIIDSFLGGPLGLGATAFSAALALAILGIVFAQAVVVVKLSHALRDGFENKVLAFLTYDRGMATSASLSILGLLLNVFFVVNIQNWGEPQKFMKVAAAGLGLIILGGLTFSFTLILELFRRQNHGK